MTTRFRVVDHSLTGQRFRTVSPASHQYMSAAQAALRSQLTGEQSNPFQSNYSNMPMNPTPGGSDGAAGIGAGVGLDNPAQYLQGGPNAGPGGLPGSTINDALGPGTELGARFRQSALGTAIADQLGSSHDPLRRFGGKSWNGLFGVGGQLSGRGRWSQWVSEGRHHGEHGWKVSGDLAAFASKLAKFFGVGIPESVPWFIHAGKKVQWTLEHPGMNLKYYGKLQSDFDPNQWVESPTVGRGGTVGYYPTATPEQSGGHATFSALMLNQLAEAWRRMQQQAHSPAGSDAAGGGGTSTAPERLFLHGMKHPFDWVAAPQWRAGG